MKVIGITGPTGAGKTTALNALVSLGGRIIDADAVYHTLTRTSQPMRQELEARFGPVYTPQGELDRKKLGAVVFQDPQALADLNAITHRYVGQAVAQQVAEGTLKPEDITEEMMSDHMYTAGQKDPDFILRPSGEKRLSNFMLWQAAYSELVEMDVLWPDFTRSDLDAAIEEFNHRSRRFGGL